jgi:hypothetical protein
LRRRTGDEKQNPKAAWRAVAHHALISAILCESNAMLIALEAASIEKTIAMLTRFIHCF